MSVVARQGLANIYEGECSNSTNFEGTLSHAHWNFEEQNKVLEFSIIIFNCCIMRPIINAYYNYII